MIPILTYFAHPIDFSDGASPDHVAAILQQGTMLFRPGMAFQMSGVSAHPEDTRIDQINRAALEAADAVIAYLPAGVRTYGVPREIEAAKTQGKPLVIVTDNVTDLRRSFALADVPVHHFEHFDAIFHDLEVQADHAPEPWVSALYVTGTRLQRGYPGDAGYDLVVSIDTPIPPGVFVDIPLDGRVAFPDGVFGRITGRSSTLRKRGLLVNEGILDCGYRGPLFAGVWNMTGETVLVNEGERIAQLILAPLVTDPMFKIETVSANDFQRIPHDGRGSSGFGSTGR